MSGFFHHLHQQRRCLNKKIPEPKKKKGKIVCLLFILLILRVAILAEFVCFFFFPKISFPFYFNFFLRIVKVVGNDLTLPMSVKCGFFTAPLNFFFFILDELLFTCVIKTHLTFSLFSFSLFFFSFSRLLLWVLAAAFIIAIVDVSIRYPQTK
jgi:hypothetical protein